MSFQDKSENKDSVFLEDLDFIHNYKNEVLELFKTY